MTRRRLAPHRSDRERSRLGRDRAIPRRRKPGRGDRSASSVGSTAHPGEKAARRAIEFGPSDLPDAADVDVEAALATVHQRMEPRVGRAAVYASRAAAGIARRRSAVAVATPRRRGRSLGVVTFDDGRSTVRPSPTAAHVRDSNRTARLHHARRRLARDSRSRQSSHRSGRLRSVGARRWSSRATATFDVRHDAGEAVHRSRRQCPRRRYRHRRSRSRATFGDTTTVVGHFGQCSASGQLAPRDGGDVLAAGDRGSLTARWSVHAYPTGGRCPTIRAWTHGRARVPRRIHARGLPARSAGGTESTCEVADSSLLSVHVTTTFGETIRSIRC